MPKLKFIVGKRQIQAICGIAAVVIVLAMLVVTYPHLQLHLANHFFQSGNYHQAEQILIRLVEGKPDWMEPRYQLAFSQLYLGKGSEAASTVISLADTNRLDDVDLAIIYMDVAEHLLNTGHSDIALDLANKLLLERPNDEMLNQAVVEIGFTIAEYSNLPLSLDALNIALALMEDNWLLNRKAFNLLLNKALEAPADLAEPALDAALKLYPNNIIALTSKATLLGQRSGPKSALEFLVQREEGLTGKLDENYLGTKRSLIARLADHDPEADLTKYIRGIPQSTVVELAVQGLIQAWRQEKPGHQYYQLAVSEPEVAYQYGRNLIMIEDWDRAELIFRSLQKLSPSYTDFKAIYALLDSKTKTQTEGFHYDGYFSDMASISPDGTRLALRLWMSQPPVDEFMLSNLVVSNLTDANRKSLGDAQVFQWSPDGKYLVYLTNSATGLNRLQIYSVLNDTIFTLSGSYNVITFNWAGSTLMVQAEKNYRTHLIHLAPSNWGIIEELYWDTNSAVNHDYAWISIAKKQLLVHRHQLPPLEFSFENELIRFTDWSPDGYLAVVTDQFGQNWLYDYRSNDITEIDAQGEFAAWGYGQDIYWYLPVWDKQYVLVRLDSTGKIKEYLPYSFTYPYFDLTVTADGGAIVMVEDNEIIICRR